jgi:hypothetical protein
MWVLSYLKENTQTFTTIFPIIVKPDLMDTSLNRQNYPIQQKDRHSNVFRPVYNGLFVLQTQTLIFYPCDFITDKDSSSNLNIKL